MGSLTVRVPCMFCGKPLRDEGEAYYDHIHKNRSCEWQYESWLENLVADHPGG
ncbi:MAG: DUF7501 family protein [Methanobacteriota archaeon]